MLKSSQSGSLPSEAGELPPKGQLSRAACASTCLPAAGAGRRA
jgi:hypothetical protein